MNLALIRRHVFTMTFGILLGRVLGFAQGILIARLLGPAALGMYVTLILACGLLSRISDVGLPHATVYYLRRMPGAGRSLLRILAFHALVCSVVAALCTWLIRYAPLPIAKEIANSPWLATFFFVSVNLGSVANILPQFLMAAGVYRQYVTVLNTSALLQILLQLTACYAFGPSFYHLFAATVTAQVLMALFLSVRLYRQSGQSAKSEKVTAQQAYSYALKAQWGVLMKLANTQLEVPLLSAILPPRMIGHYSVGASLREAALIPQGFYTGILQNLLVDRNKIGEREGGLLVLKCIVLQGVFSLALLCLVLIALPIAIPFIYGHSYENAVPVAQLLACAGLLTGISSLCWTDFHAKGRPQITSLAQTFSGLFGPILLYILAGKFGLLGAGIASLISALITFVISFSLVFRLNGFSLVDLFHAIAGVRTFAIKILQRNKKTAPDPIVVATQPYPEGTA